MAEPAHLLLSADYSQIELRILAHVSGDATLIDAFQRGEDIRDRASREVFGPFSPIPTKAASAPSVPAGVASGSARSERSPQARQPAPAAHVVAATPALRKPSGMCTPRFSPEPPHTARAAPACWPPSGSSG